MEEDSGAKKRSGVPRPLVFFVGILLLEWASALGLLALWSYAAFGMRFSAEVIRAGLVLLYIIPCLLGGRMVRRAKLRPFLPWSVAVGTVFYGGLSALSFAETAEVLINPELVILCTASAVLGVFLGKKGRLEKKSEGNK